MTEGIDSMYIELHSRSAFSFLEGSSLPEDMAAMCAKFNMPAMALLDTDGIYGAPRFHHAAEKIGIKAHIGAEVTCENSFRLPLLVSSRPGYQNLCRLITKMKLRAKKGEGAVLPKELEQHAEGLICLTGGANGPLATVLQQGGIEAASKQVEQLIALFGRKNVYIELQRHFHREEESRNRAAIDICSIAQASSARDEWSELRHGKRSRTLRCFHRNPPSPHPINRRTFALSQRRASLKIPARDATTFCRPA